MTAPAWIVPMQGQRLKPPPEVLALGLVRSAANLLAVAAALCFTSARRYQPEVDGRTWCNIALADALDILCPDGLGLPHQFHGTEQRANMIGAGLAAGTFPGGWSKVQPNDVANRCVLGLPTIATWINPVFSHPGHVMLCVPAPADHVGEVCVSGAGGRCLHQAPIAQSFGKLPVIFYGRN